MSFSSKITRASLLVLLSATVATAGDWPRRFGGPQGTGNAGDAGLDPATATSLERIATLATADLPMNHTPVVSDGLIFYGDWNGVFHVHEEKEPSFPEVFAFDTDAFGVDTGSLGAYIGIQSTPHVATVTVPTEDGSREERRVYVGANDRPNLYCFSIDAIRADLAGGPVDSTGAKYLCESPADAAEPVWPLDLAAPAALIAVGQENPNPVYNGSPLIVENQLIRVGENESGEPILEERDVIFTPSTGLDCSNGQFYAIDAYTGEKYWTFDPVVNGDGAGGVVWTAPAMDRAGEHLYFATGDCVQKPQVGEKAESLMALDPKTGDVKWWHQRRLIDTMDLDIGNSPTVVDVEGANGCHNVVSIDKDGCIYAFPQVADSPDVGDTDFDPLRIGQQRLLWRTCFVGGSLNGGFNASGGTFHDRYVFAQSNPIARVIGDNASTFAIDACTGDFQWASTAIQNGRGEGAAANGMFFQPSGRFLYVAEADGGTGGKPDLLAKVELSAGATAGGGGPAVANGRIYVPTSAGVDVIAAGNDPSASPPPADAVTFKGPYPYPVAPDVSTPIVVDPTDPYPAVIDLD